VGGLIQILIYKNIPELYVNPTHGSGLDTSNHFLDSIEQSTNFRWWD